MSENERERLESFKLKEQEVLSNLIKGYQPKYDENYEYWDLLIPEKKVILELKTRHFSLDFYNKYYDNEPLIEVKKYNNCMEKAARLGYDFYFAFAFYSKEKFENSIYLYHISNMNKDNFRQINLWLPVNSFSDNKQVKKTDVYIIPMSEVKNNIYKIKTFN